MHKHQKNTAWLTFGLVILSLTCRKQPSASIGGPNYMGVDTVDMFSVGSKYSENENSHYFNYAELNQFLKAT